jgi:hypothetical protein
MLNVPAGPTVLGEFLRCAEDAGDALAAELYRLLLAPADAPPPSSPIMGDPRLAAWAAVVLHPIQLWVNITAGLVANLYTSPDPAGLWTGPAVAQPAFVRRMRREVLDGYPARTGDPRPLPPERHAHIRMLWSVDINATSHGILFGLQVSTSSIPLWRNPYTSLYWWEAEMPIPPGIDLGPGLGPGGGPAEATWKAAPEHVTGTPLNSPPVFMAPIAAREQLHLWQRRNATDTGLIQGTRYPAWWHGIDPPGPAAHAPGRMSSSFVPWPGVPTATYIP